MTGTKRVVVAACAAIGLLVGVQPTPAHAATEATASFVVTLFTPSLGPPQLNPSASGSLAVGSTVSCTDVVVSASPSAGACSVQGAGTSTGTCGLASGTLTGAIVLDNGTQVYFATQWVVAGALFVATGTVSVLGQSGPITVVAEILPSATVPPTQSCISGNQNQFTLGGTAEWVAG